MIDSTLSHYKILSELGRGGMGIVYKAEDTKLDRTVAIKVLPSAALANEDDRERFYREAKAAAQLHHPHIASIFEIDEAVPSDAPHGTEPSPFIAMEFVNGGTLRDEIEKGPMKLTEAARITSQVAEALKLAHSKEIVHRDIKSHNVMLTKDGDAKVLDFGLAKTAQSTMLTRMGSTLGTVAYMSPEQARGDEVDHRTDIWSLGVMLFEMVAGRLPFAGEYEKAVMYGILNEMAPPLTSLRTGVPMGLEWIVSKCLAKSPDERYQNAADLIVDLKTVDLSASGLSRTSSLVSTMSAAGAVTGGTPTTETSVGNRSFVPLMYAFIGALVLLVIGVLAGRAIGPGEVTTPKPVQRYTMTFPGLRNVRTPDPSPDGNWMVVEATDSTGWSGAFRIRLESGTHERVSGTENGEIFQYSPEGERLMFFSNNDFVSVLPADGGSAVNLTEGGNSLADWLPDGSILYGKDDQIWKVNPSGDDAVQVTTPDSAAGEIGHYNPAALPDTRYVLIHVVATGGVRTLAVLDLETGQHSSLGPGSTPTYVPTGHVIYFDGAAANQGQLLARSFDIKTREFVGPTSSIAPQGSFWTFGFSRLGTWYDAFVDDENVGNGVASQFFISEDGANTFSPTGLSGEYNNFRVSPDGSKIAVSLDRPVTPDYVVVLDRESLVELQITFSGDADYLAWSPDGSRLYIEVDSHLEVFSADGAGRIASFTTREDLASFDIAPDESYVIYVDHPTQGAGSLHKFTFADSSDVEFREGEMHSPRISPDGKYVAFTDEDQHVYVKEIDGEGFYLASRDVAEAHNAVWGPRGDYLYFTTAEQIARIPISLTDGFAQLARAEELVQFPGGLLLDISVSGILGANAFGGPGTDGPATPQSDRVIPSYNVIVNWFEELKRLAPRDDN